MEKQVTSKQKLLPITQSSHWLLRKSLAKVGFFWEVRRYGELGIGVWRKTFDKKRPTSETGVRKVVKRLVVIPGLGDTPASWLPIITAIMPILRTQYDEIVLLDFPGFAGNLAAEPAYHSMDHLFDCVSDVLNSLKPEAILGHSLGGWLSARFCAEKGIARAKNAKSKNPKKETYAGPERLILCAAAGVYQDEADLLKWQTKFERAIVGGLDAIRGDLFFKEPYFFKYVIPEFGAFFSRDDIAEFIRSVREEHLVGDNASYIQVPDIWVLWGDQDAINPTHWLDIWVKKLSENKVHGVLFKNTGHSIQVEKPAQLISVLGQIFLGRVPRSFRKNSSVHVFKPEVTSSD